MTKQNDDQQGGGIHFEGDTTIMGDQVEKKIVFGGEVHGSQIIGRDQISITGDGNVTGDRSSSIVTKRNPAEINIVTHFAYLQSLVLQQPISARDKQDVGTALRNLEKEIGKDEKASLDKISPWLKMIKQKAPGIVGSLLEVLVHPLVGKAVAAVSKAILEGGE
jgi:hypothetical protein